EKSKENKRRPCIVIAHTLKGWGLEMAAQSANHSALPDQSEVDRLREAQGLTVDQLFGRFSESSEEGTYLKARGEKLYKEILEQHEMKAQNWAMVREKMHEIPDSLNINLKMVNYPHTQWMLGQLTAKLTRIANDSEVKAGEEGFKVPGELLVSMAPDVGTSTNLNPAMDGKIFGAVEMHDYEEDLQVKDRKAPDLIPGEEHSDRFLRFEIAEANVTSCVGSFGRMRDILGIPLIPLMTVYDFFVKRALDQHFYNLYWKSSFLLVGTPSGVTLSPEGAQHGWKSDFQIPNQITWEPLFCQELDWIFVDSLKRHLLEENDQRTGVNIRGTTRGIDQKLFLGCLRKQLKYKSSNQTLVASGMNFEGAIDESTVPAISDDEIMQSVRTDVLNGGYYLIDYRGYAGYEPGDNVVHLFTMGSPTTEAIAASDELLKKGIYANVVVVTSTDLLIGNLADQNNFFHLKEVLGIDSTIYFQPYFNGSGADRAEMVTLSGRRIPIVSVHDGEPGLLDNIGSIVGTRQICLAVKKHSKCGRPTDVYKFHKMDKDSILEAVGKVLSETALEKVKISRRALSDLEGNTDSKIGNWRELWPEVDRKH
ncbi:MAG: pyruvate dehydrogenase, partial [Bdellovibrionales bacterium]|nr:pyruvate dehydrogenase [Bdellovibrionales bacterium]